MDADKFDALARSVSDGQSLRTALRRLFTNQQLIVLLQVSIVLVVLVVFREQILHGVKVLFAGVLAVVMVAIPILMLIGIAESERDRRAACLRNCQSGPPAWWWYQQAEEQRHSSRHDH